MRLENVKEIVTEYPFNFIHGTSFQNMIQILSDGYLRIGTDIPSEENKRLSNKDEPLKYIFGSMYFPDLKNIKRYPGFSLIISPFVLADQNIVFNKGWYGKINNQSIILDSNDGEKLNDNIRIIREILKDNMHIPTELNVQGWMTHEIMFEKNIKLKDYLIGIVCFDCTMEQVEVVRHHSKKYTNTNIILEKMPF